jgi:hypothetical protein
MALADFLKALLDGGQPSQNIAGAPMNGGVPGTMAPGASPLQLALSNASSDQGTAGPVGTAAYQDTLQRMFAGAGQPQGGGAPSGNPGEVHNNNQPPPNYSPTVNGRPPLSAPASSGGANGLASVPTYSGGYSHPDNGGGFGNFIGGFLQDLIDPQARGRNATIDWLQRQGMDAGTATLYAGDKALLRQYLANRVASSSPEEALKTQKLGLEVDALRNPTTNDIKEYQYAKSNGGYQGTFQNWMLENKRAGATSISDIGNTKGETTYDQTVGKNLGEKTVSIMDSGMQAANKIGSLQLLKEALGNVYQGTGGTSYQSLRRLGQSMGFDVQNVGDGDLAQSISRQMALQLRDPSNGAGMPGAMSDADREYLMSMVPSLSKTPEGNAQIIDYMIRLQQRNQNVAQMARTYMGQNGGRLDYKFFGNLADWTKANPLFPQSQDDQERQYLDRQYRNGSTGDSGPSRVRNPATPGTNAPTRAVNPQTGQRLELQNGKWVPVQ